MLPTRYSGCKGTTNLLIIKDFAVFFIFHSVIDMGKGALEMVTVECYFIELVDADMVYYCLL